jgi:5-hydroxyisourate hydrolase-like protein (transthyretin family)
VSFGFLEYSLPTNPESHRAWRITWGTNFFEFCKAAGGYLLFDLDTYRQLDFASRRLFLALKKVFHRCPISPVYDVRHLGVNILGFAASTPTYNLKIKLSQCTKRLAKHEIIELPQGVDPDGVSIEGLFEKKGKGFYTIQFHRGRYFEKPQATRVPASAAESAMYEPLRAIGFEDAAIARIVTKYRPELIQTWTDITLAAKEKHGTGFFKRSPQAYFMDNIEKASQGTRTPPDWWHEYRKEEDRRERESKRQVLGLPVSDGAAKEEKDEDQAFEEYLRGEAREAVQAIVEQTVKEFQGLGLSAGEIARRAAEQARRQMRTRFRREHPEYEQVSGPKPLADILKGLVPKGPPCDSSPSRSLFGEAGKAAFPQNLENRNTETQKGDKAEMQGCPPYPAPETADPEAKTPPEAR